MAKNEEELTVHDFMDCLMGEYAEVLHRTECDDDVFCLLASAVGRMAEKFLRGKYPEKEFTA